MQLIYTDESGINYSNTDGLFKDGPYIFYGAICIDEKKYFHLERLFIDIIKTYFSIDDWKDNEVHASDIWNQVGYFKNFDKKTIITFFNELLQLLVKLDIRTIVGQQKKTIGAENTLKQREESLAIYSFIHGVEKYLANKSETGIIIADQKQSDENSNFSRIFYDRSIWRTSSNSNAPLIRSKFIYETRLCFLIDNIHFVDSRNSLFVQITDIVLYIIMRVWTYQRLRIDKIVPADINKIPIEKDTFQYFAGSVLDILDYDIERNDVSFNDLSQSLFLDGTIDPDAILSDELFKRI